MLFLPTSLPAMLLWTAVLLCLAGYAHYRIAFHTAKRRNVLLTRAVLIAVGSALGTVAAATYTGEAGRALVFLAAFGAVHLPAALILFLKQLAGASRS